MTNEKLKEAVDLIIEKMKDAEPMTATMESAYVPSFVEAVTNAYRFLGGGEYLKVKEEDLGNGLTFIQLQPLDSADW